MFFKGYKIASPGAVVALVCFFLPWVFVSCYGQPVAQFSGYDLASGPMIQSPLGGAERTDPIPILFSIPIAGLLTLALAFMATKRQYSNLLDKLGAIALGLLPLAAVVINFFSPDVLQELEDLTQQGISVELRVGFWGTLLGLAAITVGGILNWIWSEPPPGGGQ